MQLCAWSMQAQCTARGRPTAGRQLYVIMCGVGGHFQRTTPAQTYDTGSGVRQGSRARAHVLPSLSGLCQVPSGARVFRKVSVTFAQ